MKPIAFAWLRDESPFYKFFAAGRVPILGPVFQPVILDGTSEEAYFVDLENLREDQRRSIAGILAERSGENPAVIYREFMELGLPLRMSQVKRVEFHVRLLL